ncbi:hypothetical protein AJ85_17305 [Alkalihalobacillus alcalophilus ATCC 27647 = CGMCC 1.3604]|uniref:Uncharacterized protein n=1 Tax=Alkalihalobacillus alcalophilus ATCC 27647 = CGMCC 1.3604 TaxID=1218173 RepID=A0A094WFV8_ALKAL|nr:DUF2198 family protein [Alkalihalobacillus alcalophilus]KGA95661.1 hypothetical protein BALCAV_0221100 [Alkalihalobacillus alcalophilus ATCC 27647 = CGMCC 1.3604]MED1564076.1 DUF2198 family protein [Alkalihalobacillus alcalophilus]THG89501.1 hypothetical protein AJ85_17305 [Alkalihalobacillus alcalophilus ATCC 27647 = CGMCC 1.3604]
MEWGLVLIAPLLLTIILTRVSFSLVGATIVTWMILIFAVRVHEMPWYLLLISIVSYIIGLLLSQKVLRKKPGM